MPQSIEEDFKRNNVISLFNLYDHALEKKSCPRGHEIYNLVDPSLVIISINLACPLYATSPYEWKILDRDGKPQTNKQTISSMMAVEKD